MVNKDLQNYEGFVLLKNGSNCEVLGYNHPKVGNRTNLISTQRDEENVITCPATIYFANHTKIIPISDEEANKIVLRDLEKGLNENNICIEQGDLCKVTNQLITLTPTEESRPKMRQYDVEKEKKIFKAFGNLGAIIIYEDDKIGAIAQGPLKCLTLKGYSFKERE